MSDKDSLVVDRDTISEAIHRFDEALEVFADAYENHKKTARMAAASIAADKYPNKDSDEYIQLFSILVSYWHNTRVGSGLRK